MGTTCLRAVDLFGCGHHTCTYGRLDLTQQEDRLGRVTRHVYDGYGRRTATIDPTGRTVSVIWCSCGRVDALVDAKGQRTRWEYDAANRVTREVRADNTTDTLYAYDGTGRLSTVTDPMDQVTTYTYNLDDSVSSAGFTNETIATADLSHTYDAYYPRPLTMVDGNGTTTYTYKAAGTLGAGQLASVDGPLTNDTIHLHLRRIGQGRHALPEQYRYGTDLRHARPHRRARVSDWAV